MAKKGLKKIHIAMITVIAVIVALLIAMSIYCVSTEQTPPEAIKSIFSSDEELLVAKWQSQSAPGLSAYVFYDDGTYDSYLSSVNFSGKYTVKGNKLTLRNPDTEKDIVYKYKITGKVLTLTLFEEDGEKVETPEESKYDKVDELNQKTLSDLIGEIQADKEKKDSTEKSTEKNEDAQNDTTK